MSLSKHQQKLYKKEKEMKAKLAAGQTPEERKAAREAAAAGAQAFKCLLCMQTFSVSQGTMLVHMQSCDRHTHVYDEFVRQNACNPIKHLFVCQVKRTHL